MTHDEIITRATRFVKSIGISIEEGTVGEECFVPGIEIRNGKLVYDPGLLKYPGDIFHEAGHIAVSEPAARATLSGPSIAGSDQKEGEEIAAILWSYFAAMHAGVPLREVLHEHGYKGEADWIVNNFTEGKLVGLPLLQWMGIVAIDEKGEPRINSWLRA